MRDLPSARAGGAGVFLAALLASCVGAQPPHDHARHAPPRREIRPIPDELPASERRLAEAYRRVRAAVVTVYTAEMRGGALHGSLGTGVLISPACHVLTAAHVPAGASAILVKTRDGERRRARVIYSEPGADIALLQLVPPDPRLPHAELGDSDRLVVGQTLCVLGNPRGLEDSLSVGHVSAFRESGRLYDGTIPVELIQTDAAINSGNSGGPVFDSSGRVVGIASRILTHSGGSEGLGFVVAIDTAKKLLALEDRVWTGIEGLFLSHEDLAALFHLDLPGALLVQHVAPDSPAARAGIRGGSIPARIGARELLLGGDLVVAIGDQEACHAACLARAHDRLTRADRIAVTLLRGGRRVVVELDVHATHRNFLGGRAGK